MTHEYKLLERGTDIDLGIAVTRALGEGWELWGNPFVQEAVYEGEVEDIHYFQAVVRFDLSGHEVVGKLDFVLREPAGYTVGVPETPGEQARPTVQVPILLEFTYKPVVESAQALVSGVPCACFEKAGDNPQCRLHGDGPIRFGGVR